MGERRVAPEDRGDEKGGWRIGKERVDEGGEMRDERGGGERGERTRVEMRAERCE